MASNPFDLILSQKPPKPTRLESGQVLAVTGTTCTIRWGDVDIPDLPFVGETPAVDGWYWMLRQGATMIVLSGAGGTGGSTVGPPGPPGPGVPIGGSVGQLLAKAGAGDYNTAWVNPTPPHIIDPAEPVAPADGTLWVDPTDGTFRVWDQGNLQWIEVQGGGSSSDIHVVDETAPSSPTDGLLWTHPTELALQRHPHVVDPNQPGTPVDGTLWTDPVSGVTRIWDGDGAAWLVVGSGVTGGGGTGPHTHPLVNPLPFTFYYAADDSFEKVDYPDLLVVRVRLVGGGAGGGGTTSVTQPAGGGGAGGYAEAMIPAELLDAIVPVIIGLGGLGGAAGDFDGLPGGTTSFGTLVSATGGNPGGRGSVPFGGAGGIGTLGDFVTSGGPGGPGSLSSGPGSGHGGNSLLGGGAGGRRPGASSNGADALGYGGGGSGGIRNVAGVAAGGAGRSGTVILDLFFAVSSTTPIITVHRVPPTGWAVAHGGRTPVSSPFVVVTPITGWAIAGQAPSILSILGVETIGGWGSDFSGLYTHETSVVVGIDTGWDVAIGGVPTLAIFSSGGSPTGGLTGWAVGFGATPVSEVDISLGSKTGWSVGAAPTPVSKREVTEAPPTGKAAAAAQTPVAVREVLITSGTGWAVGWAKRVTVS